MCFFLWHLEQMSKYFVMLHVGMTNKAPWILNITSRKNQIRILSRKDPHMEMEASHLVKENHSEKCVASWFSRSRRENDPRHWLEEGRDLHSVWWQCRIKNYTINKQFSSSHPNGFLWVRGTSICRDKPALLVKPKPRGFDEPGWGARPTADRNVAGLIVSSEFACLSSTQKYICLVVCLWLNSVN